MAYKYLSDKMNKSKEKKLKVLIFNELSGACATDHMAHNIFACNKKQCYRSNLLTMLNIIKEAQYSIDIAIYMFTVSEIRDAFKQAMQRGVSIRIITDHEMAGATGSQVKQLNNSGIEVRSPDNRTMMHHKFIVIDGHERVKELLRERGQKPDPYCSTVLTGSLNWTMQALTGNWENCIISSDDEMTTMLEAEFLRMWKSFENSAAIVGQYF